MTTKPEQESLSGRSNAKPEELRECAYCKADESQIDSVRRYNEAQDKYFHYVDCNSCEMSGPTKDTEQEAIAAWNSLPRPACDWRTHMTTEPEQERELKVEKFELLNSIRSAVVMCSRRLEWLQSNSRPTEAQEMRNLRMLLADCHDYIESRASDWVPVGERLPEVEVNVMLAAGDLGGWFGYRECSKVSGQSFWYTTYGDVLLEGVTHWMPLPPPPAVDESGGGE